MIRATIGILAGTGRKPVALAATGVGETSFTANWEAFEGAVYYLLDVSTQQDFSTFVYENQVINAPTTSYVVIGLEDNTTYYYRLRASTEPLYLLDEWEYPDAAAGYSLRKLRHEYKGAAVEVRNDSGVHLDIGFDENGDLDTAALLAHCGAGNGTVSTWYDQSGGGNDATQAVVANQPQIVSIGSVITENGKPALEFDGSDDVLSYSLSLSVGSNTSIIAVSTTASNTLYWRHGSFDYWYLISSQSFRYRNGDFDKTWSSSDGVPIMNNIQKLIATYKTSNSALLSINGSDVSTVVSGTGSSGRFNNIGSNVLYLNGSFQELIVYTSDQASNRTGIETNINAEYQIYWDGSQTSLLDSYGGSAAAYSLRALSSSYTGPLVEVRNDSGVHADIYAKYDGSLNTDALLAHCGSGDGTVSTWYDQSGNGNDATQTTAASQPKIYDSSSGVILENGKPAVQFDGSNDVLSTSRILSTNTWSIFNVVKINTIANSAIEAQHRGLSDVGRLSVVDIDSASSKFRTFFNNGVSISGLHPTLINTNQYLVNSFAFDNDYYLSLNSDYQEVISNQTLTPLNTDFSIGGFNNAANPWDGGIQEIIVYTSDQSSNRTGIETNINANYNIYWDGSQTSLLDTYGGSAAAYSLRALSSSYTGPLVEVRRASDNATQDIYAKYDGSLNVDALESFCSGTNGFVSTWYDQSGNGNDATQANASEQPQIVNSGSVITENGKPAIQNSATTGFNLTSNITIDSFTILWVAKKDTIASNGSIMLYISAATFLGDDVNGRGNPTFWGMIETQYSNTSASDIEINQHLSYLNRRNSTEAVGQFNDSNNSYNNSVNSTQYQISKIALYGTSYNYIGNIQELIIYSSDESSNRTGISNNINSHYNIY